MGPVGTDQVPNPHLLLAVREPQTDIDPVGSRLERDQLNPTLDMTPQLVQPWVSSRSVTYCGSATKP
jgi:hypothetical protein